MMINIGSSDESSDLVGLLMACHERIRLFIDLAQRLAEAQNVSREEVKEAATRVLRYFSESLPLHVKDEEESILPRLSGREPELERALETMRREHREHTPQLQALLEICRTLQVDPGRLPETKETLSRAATDLKQHFAAHLQEEERIILPAINALLTNHEREAMLVELRARRQ
jgi:iron-sulfur cluster repair protein YtfE (RIC family)